MKVQARVLIAFFRHRCITYIQEYHEQHYKDFNQGASVDHTTNASRQA